MLEPIDRCYHIQDTERTKISSLSIRSSDSSSISLVSIYCKVCNTSFSSQLSYHEMITQNDWNSSTKCSIYLMFIQKCLLYLKFVTTFCLDLSLQQKNYLLILSCCFSHFSYLKHLLNGVSISCFQMLLGFFYFPSSKANCISLFSYLYLFFHQKYL